MIPSDEKHPRQTGASRFAALRAGRIDRRRLALSLALLGAWTGLSFGRFAPASSGQLEPFLVYYGHDADPAIGRFALAVLDGGVDRAALAHDGTTCLGYVNVGEVASYQPHYSAVLEEGILLAVNAAWPDSRYVDMRDERWHSRVLAELIPNLLAKGFDGVFLDTIDNAEYLEWADPAENAGMVEAAARLVVEMRRRFPDISIMINRGYRVLPLIAGRFDMLLGESVRSRFTEDGGFVLQPKEEYEWQRGEMWAARKRDPALRLFSLDYWDPDDRDTIAELVEEERANGFVPYVSTKDLQSIFVAS